jgi:magnesium-transporting ATPase (P-type)
VKKIIPVLLKIVSLFVIAGALFLIANTFNAANGSAGDLFSGEGFILSKISTFVGGLFMALFWVCVSSARYAIDMFFVYGKDKRKKNLAVLSVNAVISITVIIVFFINRENRNVYEWGYFFIWLYLIIAGIIVRHFEATMNANENFKKSANGERDVVSDEMKAETEAIKDVNVSD